MRIAFLFHDPLPSTGTNSEQLVQNVASLVARGVSVDLVVPRPGGREASPRDRVREIARFYGVTEDVFANGLTLVELPVPFGLTGNAGRAAHSFRAAAYVRRRAYDAVYVRDPFPLLVALRLSGHPVVFETFRADLSERRRFAPFRWACYRRRNLAGVITHSSLARDAFLRAGLRPDAVRVAHNGYAPNVMGARLTTAEARARLGLDSGPDARYVVYTGHVNEQKGLDVVVDAALRLPAVEFLLVGAIPGSEGERWARDFIAAAGASNVRPIPRVPPSDVAAYLYAADCLIIPPSARPLRENAHTVLPIKTYIYLAAGRPIVAGNLPDVREVLRDGENALLVPADDAAATANAIGKVLADPETATCLAENARRDAERYTWASRAALIAEFLEKALAAWTERGVRR